VDFRLYARVIWRFRLIVMVGLVIALALALLSLVRVSPSGFSYRHSELCATTTRLLVTQKGAPEVRLYSQAPTAPGQTAPTGGEVSSGIPIADPGRFNTLAILYAEFANSDPVRRLIRREGPIRGKVIATPLRDDQSGTLLPLIDVTAISTTPRRAVELAQRTTKALDTYLEMQQRANNVPDSDRAIIQTIMQPRIPQVYQPRSKTMAIVVFLAVMFATIGLAFLLENLRPRTRVVGQPAEPELRGTEQRRTA
jgi:hypothetical protein